MRNATMLVASLLLVLPGEATGLDAQSAGSKGIDGKAVSKVLASGILVEAVVTGVSEKQDVGHRHTDWSASANVTHVFLGPNDLLGRTFVVAGSDPVRSFSRNWICPKLREGEVALYLLTERNAELHVAMQVRLGLRWPVRKEVSPEDYRAAKRMAGMVESVVRAQPESKQRELLKGYATDETWIVSMLAIEALSIAAPNDKDVAMFLEGLVRDKRLTLTGQVALDDALLKLQGSRWQTSADRWSLLQGWEHAKPSAMDAYFVMLKLDRLGQMRATQGIEQDKLVRLVKAVATNEAFPEKSRLLVGGVIFWTARHYGPLPAAEIAVHIVEHARAPGVRRMAALSLKGLPLNEQQRAALAKVAGAVQEKEAAKVLQEALQQPGR